MKSFTPHLTLDGLPDITAGLLNERGITWLAVDLDNTVAFDMSDDMPEENARWLREMAGSGFGIVVISNNGRERVERFSLANGLDCVWEAKKPSGKGMKRAAEKLGKPISQGALVGDQIFTDVWEARRAGAFSILVNPLGAEASGFLTFKRKLEGLTKAGRKRREYIRNMGRDRK